MAETHVHPTAVVAEKSVLGDGVRIGPYCIVEPGVRIGDGVELLSHVVVAGRTEIGPGSRIFPFASIGHQPQDLKYRGEASSLRIGAECIIREGVTINPGTEGGGMLTTIGDRCAFLANSHVGHDCHIGNDVVLSNNVMIGGHCELGDFCVLGGGAGIHQFARMGAHSFLGGMAGLGEDLIPYGLAVGAPAHLSGVNIIGLQRRGFSRAAIHDLRRAYRLLFADEGTLKERIDVVACEFKACEMVVEMLDFMRGDGRRAICMPRSTGSD